MIPQSLFSLTLAACIVPCFADGAWIHDNIELAQEQAAAQGKAILIEFTGSDWCMPCNKLRRELLATPAFEAEAGRDFVLLELDYPQQKAQPAAVKEANRQLARLYAIEAFPTIIFTDAQGRPLGSFVGVKTAEEVRAYREAALAKSQLIRRLEEEAAAATTSEAAAAARDKLLKAVPEAYHDAFYGDIKDALKAQDKEDRYGYRAADGRKARVRRQLKETREYFRTHLGPYTDAEVALEVVRRCPGRDSVEPEVLQEILVTEWQCTLSATGDADAGIAILEKLIKLNPHTRLGKEAVELKELTDRQRTLIWQRHEDYKRSKGGK